MYNGEHQLHSQDVRCGRSGGGGGGGQGRQPAAGECEQVVNTSCGIKKCGRLVSLGGGGGGGEKTVETKFIHTAHAYLEQIGRALESINPNHRQQEQQEQQAGGCPQNTHAFPIT